MGDGGVAAVINFIITSIYLFAMSEYSNEHSPLQELLPQPPPSSRFTRPPLTHSATNIPRRLPSQDLPRPSRRSTAENSSGEYLHMRFMRRNVPSPSLLRPEEPVPPVPEGGFMRTRHPRAISTGRPATTALLHREAPREPPVRLPTSHHHSEKMNYFEELLSSREGLRGLKVISHIGKGAFSIVSTAVSKDGRESFAVKTYEKLDALDWNRLACIKREVRNLRVLDHPRVVKLHQLAREHRKLYLVMENAGKQSLGGLLRKEKRLPEDIAREYFREILQGVGYCHSQGVCHRDLKPQNILIDERGSIKLIDFGFSASTRALLTTYCGTPAYMSPELVRRVPYNGAKADIWALGVILYLMLVGVFPFRAPNEPELHRLILNGKVRYRDEGLVSTAGKRFILKMLTVPLETRCGVQQLLLDPWLSVE